MCNSEILHFEKAGYVIRCNNCQQYHVTFGNLCIDQSEEAFLQFKEVIEHHYRKHSNHHQPKLRDIWISTPYQGIRFLFSLEELGTLNEILQKAYLIVIAEQIAQPY